jgi:formylglycine-generating enzyme required for sulfatase activity
MRKRELPAVASGRAIRRAAGIFIFASVLLGAMAAAPRVRAAEPLKSGDTFRDCATCPEMVVIRPGSFDMGAPPDTHRVAIRHAFALGKFEVTQAEWQAVMGSNPSHFKGAHLPVEHVNWDDAQAFIRKLNRRTGRHYRLPSEAEWEYACRGGHRADDYCGGNDADQVAWYGALGEGGGNSANTTHPVGLKAPNGFGLYDMSGNVWEWMADPWHPGYGGAPADGSVWNGGGAKRVIRGGSWLDYPLLAQASYRIWAGTVKRSNDLGFRVARDWGRRGR